jgi:hypothetical protein
MFGQGKMGPWFGGHGSSGGRGGFGGTMMGPQNMGPMGSSIPTR